MSHEYDFTVIGGGPGGYVGAIRGSQLEGKVALIEKDRIGGTCLNRGCIPTKTMVHSAEVYQKSREADKYGVEIEGSINPNFSQIMERKEKVTNKIVNRVKRLLNSHDIDIYRGEGEIIGPKQVRVKSDSDSHEISTESILIATGSEPAAPPIPGVEQTGVLTTRQLLNLKDFPKSLVVIGASTIGMEFASLFNDLGANVTVLGRKTFLKDAEERISRRFRGILKKKDVDVTIGVDFKEIIAENGKMKVVFERENESRNAEGEKILLATGRRPYTEGLGLDNVGVKTEGGKILTDEYLETSVKGIYAVGDVLGTHMMAHTASYQGEIAAENALGKERKVNQYVVPVCIFTSPEIASVGVTSQEAREKDLDFKIAQFPYSANGRAVATGQEEGRVIIVHERESGKILGLHIMGAHASDLISEGVVAIQQGATVEDLAKAIHAHPTYPETVMEAAKDGANGEAIHYRKL